MSAYRKIKLTALGQTAKLENTAKLITNYQMTFLFGKSVWLIKEGGCLNA
jgi:hypothetical protein